VGSAIGQYLGLGMMFPGFVAVAVFWLLNRRQAFYPYTAAISVYWGHAAWILFGVIYVRTYSALWDVGLIVAGTLWLALRPARIAAYLMIAFSLLLLGSHCVSLGGADKATTKALITHILLDVAAVSGLVWGLGKHQPMLTPDSSSTETATATVPKTSAWKTSAWKRVGIAVGATWSSICLLAAVSATGDNHVEKLAWGFIVGALPWGCWWVLRGFEHWRRILGGFAALIVLLALGVYGLIMYRQHQDEAERLASYARVPTEQVELVDERLSGATGQYPTIVARVRNRNNKHTVTGLELSVRVFDCPSKDEGLPLDRCDVVAAPHESVYLQVPPLQSRDISHRITVPDSYTIRGHLRWGLELDRVRAAPPPP